MSNNKEELIYKYANLQTIIKNQSFNINEDEVICPICYNLILFPCICNKCQFALCKQCKIKSKNICPTCKKTEFTNSVFHIKLLSKLSFKCQNCNSEILFDNLINHYENDCNSFSNKNKIVNTKKQQKISSNQNFEKPKKQTSYNTNFERPEDYISYDSNFDLPVEYLLNNLNLESPEEYLFNDLNFERPEEYISYNSNYNQANKNQHKHRDNGYFKCEGCGKPMCKVGYKHRDNGYFKCEGCGKPMCEVGSYHRDNGFSRCEGCGRAMCEL